MDWEEKSLLMQRRITGVIGSLVMLSWYLEAEVRREDGRVEVSGAKNLTCAMWSRCALPCVPWLRCLRTARSQAKSSKRSPRGVEVAQDREPVPVLVEVPEVRRGGAVVQLVPVPKVQRVHVARDAEVQEPKKDVCGGLGVESA